MKTFIELRRKIKSLLKNKKKVKQSLVVDGSMLRIKDFCTPDTSFN